jgi:hypothetical protein
MFTIEIKKLKSEKIVNLEMKACRHCLIAFDDTVNRWNKHNIEKHETSCVKNPINISVKKTKKINIPSTGQKTIGKNFTQFLTIYKIH